MGPLLTRYAFSVRLLQRHDINFNTQEYSRTTFKEKRLWLTSTQPADWFEKPSKKGIRFVAKWCHLLANLYHTNRHTCQYTKHY